MQKQFFFQIETGKKLFDRIDDSDIKINVSCADVCSLRVDYVLLHSIITKNQHSCRNLKMVRIFISI